MKTTTKLFFLTFFLAIFTTPSGAVFAAPATPAPCDMGQEPGSGYYFDSFEDAEYVNDLLVIHLRLHTPYNDGRPFYSSLRINNSACSQINEIVPTNAYPFFSTYITPHAKNFSIRFSSTTHYDIWNDETNAKEDCPMCSVDLPADNTSPYISWRAFIDGGASRITTHQYLIYLPSAPQFIPTCCSSVLFIPGIEGSELNQDGHLVWPPRLWQNFGNDVLSLALTPEGQSVNPTLVGGIVNSFDGTAIYQGFTDFMNGLSAINASTGTSTIQEWQGLAYDWRYAPKDIVTNGIETTNGFVDPVHEVEKLAHNSKSGKVTIVAHSMGGLVGKALIKALEEKGESDLIESFVMIGTPQLGTPSAVSGLLHGDELAIPAGFILPGIIANPATVRKVAANMPGAYSLLPSSEYFNRVSDPIVTFDPNASFTAPWRAYFGETINSYGDYASFLTASDVPRTPPSDFDLAKPTILSTSLVAGSKAFHDEFDNYAIPSNIRTVQVAGWGLPTVKSITYKNEHFFPGFETKFTVEGDASVLYPSAGGNPANESYFLYLFLIDRDRHTDFQHRDIVAVPETQKFLESIFHNSEIKFDQYLLTSKPQPADTESQLNVTAHSPIVMGVYDSEGHFTGVLPNQDMTLDFLRTKEEIPNSSFLVTGESENLFLPKTGTYNFVVQGTGEGPATINIQDFTNDTATDRAVYSDIPVSTSTLISFTVAPTATEIHLVIDTDKDGKPNQYVAPDNGALTLGEMFITLKDLITHLDIKTTQKTKLLDKVSKTETKIAKKKNTSATNKVMQLEKAIARLAAKKVLTDAEVTTILNQLADIETAI